MSTCKVDKIVLQKVLGLHHAISICIGATIGSGIFVSPVGILSHVGSIGTSLILWIFCGVCQLLFGLCFAELGCRIPISGAHYVYLNTVFGGLIACINLWTGIVDCVLAMSVYYGVLTRYLFDPLFLDCEIPTIGLNLTYFIVHGLIIAMNCYSVRLVARLQVLFSVAKIAALFGVILLGTVNMISGELGQLANPFEESNYSPTSYALAFYSGAWALAGWEAICCVVGEMKHPKRDLRLALIISIGVTTGIYMLANIAYASVLTKQEMLSSPAVVVTFARKTMGPVWWIMPLCVAMSVFGTVLGAILCESRVFYMGAKQGHLPYVLSYISIENRTPVVCLILLGILGCISTLWKSVFYLMELSGFLGVFFQMLTILALIILRYKDPHPTNKIVKAPFLVPELCFLLDLVLVLLTIYKRPLVTCLLMIIMFVAFTVMYFVCVKWKGKPEVYFSVRDSVTRTLQKWLMCVPEEI